MNIKQFFSGISGLKFKGSFDKPITGISSDSRTISPGNLFLARCGKTYNGCQFIQEAIDAGASGIITDLYNPFIKCPQVICEDPGKYEALLASKIYKEPSKKLFTVGVTGSKGKTTTTYLCKHLLDAFEKKAGLLGTIEVFNGKESVSSSLTTHGAAYTQKILFQMVQEKCQSAVIEVSSHALDQSRVNAVDFDLGIFTNLYPDHLDYHQSMEAYAQAKQKLFLMAKSAVINLDSSWADFMRMKDRITFGIEKPAEIRAEKIQSDMFFIQGVRFKTPLLGRFNLYNVLAAIGVGKAIGKSIEEMSVLFESFPGVPGRLERVSENVYVDFAHTGESLQLAIRTLKELTNKRVVVVFGSGGDRDPERRYSMGRAAQQYADGIIITSDNPRTEDPMKIATDILSVFKGKKPDVILDRKEAIFKAIEMANGEDLVLIAGKGHEKMQIFSNQTVSFDDVAIAKEALCI